MLKIAVVGAVFLVLVVGSVLLMHQGGEADLDVPGRTTDIGKNTLGER
jgi:hypothetical protein